MADSPLVEERIRTYVADRGGTVDDGGGRLDTEKMAAAVGAGSAHHLRVALGRLEHDGVITREMQGPRTHRITLTNGGAPAVTPATEPAPAAPAPATPAAAEDPSPPSTARALTLRERIAQANLAPAPAPADATPVEATPTDSPAPPAAEDPSPPPAARALTLRERIAQAKLAPPPADATPTVAADSPAPAPGAADATPVDATPTVAPDSTAAAPAPAPAPAPPPPAPAPAPEATSEPGAAAEAPPAARALSLREAIAQSKLAAPPAVPDAPPAATPTPAPAQPSRWRRAKQAPAPEPDAQPSTDIHPARSAGTPAVADVIPAPALPSRWRRAKHAPAPEAPPTATPIPAPGQPSRWRRAKEAPEAQPTDIRPEPELEGGDDDGGERVRKGVFMPEMNAPPSNRVLIIVGATMAALVLIAVVSAVAFHKTPSAVPLLDTNASSIDACQVVTTQMANATLGDNAGPPNLVLGECVYDDGTHELIVEVDRINAKKLFNASRAPSAQRLPGIGDGAYYLSGSLWALKGSSLVQLTIGPVPAPTPSPQLLTLAKTVAQRL